MNLLKLYADVVVSSDQFNIPKGGLDTNKRDVIIKIIFGIFGAIAVLIITIGALRLILSRGNPEGLNRARNTIIYAAVGLLITVLAYAIVSFVVGQL